MLEFDDAIDQFIAHLRVERGLADNTTMAYGSDLMQFATHMAVREGTVAEIPARVFRVSFSGDLSYEVNVPAGYGVALWNVAASRCARPCQFRPFGRSRARPARDSTSGR